MHVAEEMRVKLFNTAIYAELLAVNSKCLDGD